MRLTCPNCDAEYEIDAAAIPAAGRDVQCSTCGHAWFARPTEAAGPGAVGGRAEDGAPDAALPAPPPLDETLRTILREEAEREARQRRADAGRGVDLQPELGLPGTASAALAPAPHPAPGRAPVSVRRPAFPDVEEINSTLRAGTDLRGDATLREAPQRGRWGAFRSGFASTLAIGLLLIGVYMAAPMIGARVPAVAPALQVYVRAVDSTRRVVGDLIQQAAAAVRSLQGEDAEAAPAPATGGAAPQPAPAASGTVAPAPAPEAAPATPAPASGGAVAPAPAVTPAPAAGGAATPEPAPTPPAAPAPAPAPAPSN